MYGVYSDDASVATGELTVTIGARGAVELSPGVSIDALKTVWEIFSLSEPFGHAYERDFEAYNDPQPANINIGIKASR